MKFLSVKICCFCCLVFAYFSFCYLVCTCFVFFVLEKFLLKKIELVLIASFTILVICTPLNPSIKIYFSPIFFFFACTYFDLWESLIIICKKSFLIYDHLQEFFWTLLICENLFIFMIICENLLEHIFAFYSLYENKQVYEYHHLKQIYYYQNIIIFW